MPTTEGLFSVMLILPDRTRFINDKNLDTLKIMNVAKNMFSAEYIISIAFETTSFSSQKCSNIHINAI